MNPLQKNRKSLFGFTLVELIVVITILAILWAIAFISFWWQASSARDSNRVADITSISKSLEIFSVKTGYYPDPSNPFLATYSWGVIWKQGTLGDSVITTLSAGWARISKKPTDPLTNTEYPYSKTQETREYAIKTDYEGQSIVMQRTIDGGANKQLTTNNWQEMVFLALSPWQGGPRWFLGFLKSLLPMATPKYHTSNETITES